MGSKGFSPCLSNGLQDALNYRSKQKYRQPDHDGTGRGSEEDEKFCSYMLHGLMRETPKTRWCFFLIFTPTCGDDAI